MAARGRNALVTIAVLAVAGAGAFWWLSNPQKLEAAQLASMSEGDATRGEQMFWAGGCASCHAAPGARGEDRLLLSGGERLDTDFGTFVVPNISPHADGIGGWSLDDFANAMLRGVSPAGAHYYPSFPYTSYVRMEHQDIADLHAFMQGLPEVEGDAGAHELGFPWSIRRGIGLWKRLYLEDGPVIALAGADETLLRGQYLVEGPGHCGECHTPRDAFGGLDTDRWLAGAPSPEGQGNIPNITGGEGGIGDWSEEDIAVYLDTGFTPDFDSAGGKMASVIQNMAQLAAEDREAIAAYLKAIPDRPRGY